MEVIDANKAVYALLEIESLEKLEICHDTQPYMLSIRRSSSFFSLNSGCLLIVCAIEIKSIT